VITVSGPTAITTSRSERASVPERDVQLRELEQRLPGVLAAA